MWSLKAVLLRMLAWFWDRCWTDCPYSHMAKTACNDNRKKHSYTLTLHVLHECLGHFGIATDFCHAVCRAAAGELGLLWMLIQVVLWCRRSQAQWASVRASQNAVGRECSLAGNLSSTANTVDMLKTHRTAGQVWLCTQLHWGAFGWLWTLTLPLPDRNEHLSCSWSLASICCIVAVCASHNMLVKKHNPNWKVMHMLRACLQFRVQLLPICV